MFYCQNETKKELLDIFYILTVKKHLKPVLKDRLIDFKRKTKCSFWQKRIKIKPVNQISMLRKGGYKLDKS